MTYELTSGRATVGVNTGALGVIMAIEAGMAWSMLDGRPVTVVRKRGAVPVVAITPAGRACVLEMLDTANADEVRALLLLGLEAEAASPARKARS